MNESERKSLLEQVLQVPGVSHACLVTKDRGVHTAAGVKPAGPEDTAWKSVQDTFNLLRLHRMESERVCWVFTDWCVLALQTADGAIGAVVRRSQCDAAEQRIRGFVGEAVKT